MSDVIKKVLDDITADRDVRFKFITASQKTDAPWSAKHLEKKSLKRDDLTKEIDSTKLNQVIKAQYDKARSEGTYERPIAFQCARADMMYSIRKCLLARHATRGDAYRYAAEEGLRSNAAMLRAYATLTETNKTISGAVEE